MSKPSGKTVSECERASIDGLFTVKIVCGLMYVFTSWGQKSVRHMKGFSVL